MFNDLFGDIGSEISEPTDQYTSEVIVVKSKSSPSKKDSKGASVLDSTVIIPALTSSEISTAEDCRLEISLEMKAEQELRRLDFTSRQRFLTGMDLKSGVEFPAIAVSGFVASGVDSSCSESSGPQNSEERSSSDQSLEGQSLGDQSSTGQSSEGRNWEGQTLESHISEVHALESQSSEGQNSSGQNSETEISEGQISVVPISDTQDFYNRENKHDSNNACRLISECVGKLIVDAFSSCYEVESVLQLCLLLNDENSSSFLITYQAMQASLKGLSTVEGASSRYWNLSICWLRMLLRQTRYLSIVGDVSHTEYVMATDLVKSPEFPRVIGKMLTTCDVGDSGQQLLGPTVVKNFKSLLKELLAMTSIEHHGIDSAKLQDILMDTLLDMTAPR